MTTHVGAARQMMTISQCDVNEYAIVCASIKQMEARRNELRDQFVEALESGALCPADGPFLVVLSYQERCAASWKDICQAVLGLLGSRLRAKAADLIASLQADKMSVAQINVRPNAEWRDE